MRPYLLAAILVAPFTTLAAQTRAQDSVAILTIIQRRANAIQHLDAELQRSIYAPQATWWNAFGVRRIGRDSIIAFLAGLYADSGFRESRLVATAPVEITFVRPDVAIAHDFQEREGQRLPDGSVINRRTRTTFVLSREGGEWLVQYQVIADERPRTTVRRP